MNTLWILFWTFLKIGLFSIGGGYAVIPLIQEQVVESCGWISAKTFSDIITISQMTPGPLAVNTSTFVGLQIAGIGGAAAATAGCVLCGVVISLALFRFFRKHQDSSYIFELLKGLKSASLGLIISAAATIFLLALFGSQTIRPEDMLHNLNLPAALLFLAGFFILRRKNAVLYFDAFVRRRRTVFLSLTYCVRLPYAIYPRFRILKSLWASRCASFLAISCRLS